MLHQKSVEQRMREIVMKKLGVEENMVTASASFAKDLKADSLRILELLMTIEEEFKIEIPDEDIGKIETVGEAIDYIRNKNANDPSRILEKRIHEERERTRQIEAKREQLAQQSKIETIEL
jgi:acyl carrier protein